MTERTSGGSHLELFGTRTCRYTEELREELDWDGRRYAMYYVDEDAAALRRLAQLVDGPCMVPVLVEEGHVKQVGINGRGCYVQTDSTRTDSNRTDGNRKDSMETDSAPPDRPSQ